MTDSLLLYLILFSFQYKARCYMMLKSLKSCKRELKVLVNAVGMVRINNHLPVARSSIIDSKSSWMLFVIFLPKQCSYCADEPKSHNHCCWQMGQNLTITAVGRWAKISQPLLLADESKSPNHCCWQMSQNLPTTAVGRWAKISQPLLLADEPKSPNHCCWQMSQNHPVTSLSDLIAYHNQILLSYIP